MLKTGPNNISTISVQHLAPVIEAVSDASADIDDIEDLSPVNTPNSSNVPGRCSLKYTFYFYSDTNDALWYFVDCKRYIHLDNGHLPNVVTQI